MTVKEYNRSVEEYCRFSLPLYPGKSLRMKRGQMISFRTAYEKLWRHVAEIEYPVVKSWLFSTAYHNMIDIIRKEKRMTSLEPSSFESEMIYESQYS